MPRKEKPTVLSADSIFASIMGELGGVPDYTCADWDPNMQQFGQAILEVVAKGGTLFIRSGSGGQSVGIAIWEGDTRHPAKWLQDAEGIDAWSAAVMAVIPKKEPLKVVGRAS
jgi:hypothetical protein